MHKKDAEINLLRKINRGLIEGYSGRVLFSPDQVIELSKIWQKIHITDDMDDYSHGVTDGIEFVLFLYERCEK